MKKTIDTAELIERIERAGRIARCGGAGEPNIDSLIGALWASFDIIDPELGNAFAHAAGAEHLLTTKRGI
jgi:hypothetical protein